MNKEELIELINESFDGVPQPETLTIHVAEAHDDYDYDNDQEHHKNDFIGRWQDVPDEHIKKCHTALSYLDKIGMRFYLPAYMVWYLRNFGTDVIWSDHTLYSLNDHADNEQLSEYHKERFSLFNDKQLHACAQFVKYCANDETRFTDTTFAQEKYDGFWKKHDNA